MSKVDVININGEKVKEIELPAEIFGKEFNNDVIYNVIKMQLAARRSGNASTKTKSEVKISGAKPWRQKGTGRARCGTAASPIWRGGGTAFGPKPRDYSLKVPKKVKRLAVKIALSKKLKEGNLIILEDANVEPKTKKAINVLDCIQAGRNALFVVPEKNENLRRAISNIKKVDLLPVIGLNVYDVFYHNKLVLSLPALEKMKEVY